MHQFSFMNINYVFSASTDLKNRNNLFLKRKILLHNFHVVYQKRKN